MVYVSMPSGSTTSMLGGAGSVSSMAYNQSNPQPPESPSLIRDVLSEIEHQANALHESISALESRLDVVLGPVPPSPALPSKGDAIAGAHLLGRLRVQVNVMSEALNRLTALRQRIEI